MAWLLLVLAGSFEVVGVVSMNRFKKKRNWRDIVIMGLAMILSFTCLSIAMQSISMGTAYAIWTGIGTVGGTMVGMLVYGESKEWRRIFYISLIISTVIGLKLIS
ncbi:DMT family transporter [Paenibacillus sp. GCM10027628]|uniref:DMT family transporter n=1 Tax=Paenibacillus sp. GCM10027628 TaxID=3273413 RepID=UPI00362AAD5E